MITLWDAVFSIECFSFAFELTESGKSSKRLSFPRTLHFPLVAGGAAPGADAGEGAVLEPDGGDRFAPSGAVVFDERSGCG